MEEFEGDLEEDLQVNYIFLCFLEILFLLVKE